VVCRPWAEQAEGPYRRDTQPLHRNIVEDRDRIPLLLGLLLVDPTGAPVTNGEIEVWHCDAAGRYSGYPPPRDDGRLATEATAPRTEYLPDQTFLRDRQPTDAHGSVEFATIYPG
jgi:protocatechuate 3,4-dioxygenase beta subunit